MTLLVGLCALLTVPATAAASTTTAPSGSAARTHRGPAAVAIPAIEAGVLPWSLGAAVSREVVVPGPGTSVTVLGGLSVAQTSLPAVFSLDTSTGAETPLGNLAVGVHDASGAVVAGKAYLFGGGSPDTVATVQQFAAPLPVPPPPPARRSTHRPVATTTTAPATVVPSPSAAGTTVGLLPEPRSDSSSATIGRVTYVVGGYDGTAPDATILATTDGHRFTVAGHLAVPVRYGAVAALAGRLYVFGGEVVAGRGSGQPADDVQVLDPKTGVTKVVAHLPQALSGAVAAVLGNHIYLAGGVIAIAANGTPGTAQKTVWAFDPVTHRALAAGLLPVPTSYAGITVLGNRAWIVGGENNGVPMASVEMMTPTTAFGTAGAVGAGSPYFGDKLLIADRGNNRLLVLDPGDTIEWTYPSVYAAPAPGGFYFPDDAFFAKHGTEIISNQEDNDTIVIIGFPSGKVLWTYGHARQAGALPGYLNTPDDAYLLKNGLVTVADANNCRILFINPNATPASQIGTNGDCIHQPPTGVGAPNGDTPLANGDVLVSEINGSWVTEYTQQGRMVWTEQLPIAYPSDPQQIGSDLYLISDYASPGGILEFTREGQVTYRYQPPSGLGELNHPSLTELLPSGVFMSNDDYRDRMVAIDPSTGALVWQYGVTDQSGTAPGYLNTPDGFDILQPDGSTPTHLVTA